MSDYANTLKGVALYALKQWNWERDRKPADESDAMIRAGRMQALAGVLRQITGRDVGSQTDHCMVLEIIRLMQEA